MSGHSKWSKIAGPKAAADQKRSGLFSKLIRNIIVAARAGADAETNFKLRLAVDRARAANMPKDNIERAIERGSGAGEGTQFDEIMYEGFGPGGVAVLVEAATDNRNRTNSEIKHIFSRCGGSLGAPNSVSWQFVRKGVIRLELDQLKDINKDDFELELIDLGAADVKEEEGGLTILVETNDFPKLKKALEAKNLTLSYSEIDWLPKEPMALDPETAEKVDKMETLLDEFDDVSNVYTNRAN